MIFLKILLFFILSILGVFIFSFIFSNEKVYYDDEFYKKLNENKNENEEDEKQIDKTK